MALTKEDLSRQFTSGQLKMVNGSFDQTRVEALDHDGLLSIMRGGDGICGTSFHFLKIVSYLLTAGSQKKFGQIINGLGVNILNKYSGTLKLKGASFMLVNLDNDGTYWAPTDLGLVRKPLIN